MLHAEMDAKNAITLQELTKHALVMYPKGYLGRSLVDEVGRER